MIHRDALQFKKFAGNDDMNAAMAAEFQAKDGPHILKHVYYGAGHFKAFFPTGLEIYLHDYIAYLVA